MGGIVEVSNALQQIQLNKTETHGAPDTSQTTSSQTGQTTQTQLPPIDPITDVWDVVAAGAKTIGTWILL
jgi:hypothetical protein